MTRIGGKSPAPLQRPDEVKPTGPSAPTEAKKPVDSPNSYENKAGSGETANRGGVKRSPRAGGSKPEGMTGVQKKEIKNAPTAQVDYKKIEDNLTGFHVSDGEAQEVASDLQKLPPQQFKDTLHRMEKDGHLKTLMDNLPDSDRRNLVVAAGNKGVLKQNPGSEAIDSYGKSDNGEILAPRDPSLYRTDNDLPKSFNDGVRAENDAMYKEYERSYEAYENKYSDRLENIRAKARKGGPDAKADALYELRKLGPPAQKTKQGGYHKDGILPSDHSPSLKLAKDVADTHAIVNGKTPEGTVTINVGVSKTFGDHEVGVDVKGNEHEQQGSITHKVEDEAKGASVTTKVTHKTADGLHETKLQSEVEVKKQTEHGTVTAKTTGEITNDYNGDLQVDGNTGIDAKDTNGLGSFKANSDGTQEGRFGAANFSNKDPNAADPDAPGEGAMKLQEGYYVGNNQVNINTSKKGAEFNADLGKAGKGKAGVKMNGREMEINTELEVAGTGGSASGKVNPETGNFELQGEANAGGVKVRGGVAFEGVKADSVRAATDSYYPDQSPWMTPYEMREGKTWAQLPPARQQEYTEKLGFNEARWNAELQRR